MFSSPHSIAFHVATASLVVADRDNYRLQVLDAASGEVLNVLEGEGCFGSPSSGTTAPWGVRVLGDMLVVAVCDSPETGSNQRLMVLSVEDMRSGGKCEVEAEVEVDPELCLTPHEMAVDGDTGDIFLACVTFADPNTGASASNVQRYRMAGEVKR
jgi:hypothetical protein